MPRIEQLVDLALPLSRDEQYYASTVFPMIVCKENFRYFDHFLRLAELTNLHDGHEAWGAENILMYTGYNLLESLNGNDKDRFLNMPPEASSPDIFIYIHQPIKFIIAIEARMFDAPSEERLQEVMDSQKAFLRAVATEMNAMFVHYALIPKMLADSFTGVFKDQIITWDQLAIAFADTGDDYFIDMLKLALKKYQALANRHIETAPELKVWWMTGQEIWDNYASGRFDIQTVSRIGGLTGVRLCQDVTTGGWRKRRYEVSRGASRNRNWFLIHDFVKKIEAHEAAIAGRSDLLGQFSGA